MHIPLTLHGSSNPAVKLFADVYLGHIILDEDSDGYWRLFFYPSQRVGWRCQCQISDIQGKNEGRIIEA